MLSLVLMTVKGVLIFGVRVKIFGVRVKTHEDYGNALKYRKSFYSDPKYLYSDPKYLDNCFRR